MASAFHHRLIHLGLSCAALGAPLVCGCGVAESVNYLDVEPATRQDGLFVVDLGLVPEGEPSDVQVEFWNVSDVPWRMGFHDDDYSGSIVQPVCEQDYDCSYVGPERHAIWTFRVDPGFAGSEGQVDVGVTITSTTDGEPLDYKDVRLTWAVCGPGNGDCP